MKLWHIRALLLCSVMTSTAVCLDPQPITVPDTRVTGVASATCQKCLATDGPQGCGDEMTACRAVPSCNGGIRCMLEQGCIGGDFQTYLKCAPECARDGGITSSDDPGAQPALLIFQCVGLGPCRSVCFTDTADGGDAGNFVTDATGGGDGGACADDADRAITADQTTVKNAATVCGIDCVGQDMSCIPTAASCMSMQAGFSSGCAQCWGEFIYCSVQKCFDRCASNPDSQDCKDCTDQQCSPAYHACSGL